MATNLLSIPPELFERVAESADPHDLLALRLTCREAASKLHRTYVAAFFTRRAFLLCNEDSLRTLLSIAESEKFGSTMEEVYLLIDWLPELDSERIHPPRRDGNGDHEGVLGEGAVVKELRQKQLDEQWHVEVARQWQFQINNSDVHLLSAIFSRFRQINNILRVLVVDEDNNDFGGTGLCPKGVTALEGRTGKRIVAGDDNIRPFWLILEALALSALPITNFTFVYDNWMMFIADLADLPRGLSNMRKVFQNLASLDLRFDGSQNVSDDLLRSMNDIIASASSLERLCLRHCSDFRTEDGFLDHTFTEMLLNNRFPMLKSFILEDFLLDFVRLTNFIRGHAALEYIELVTCEVNNTHAVTRAVHFWLGHLAETLRKHKGPVSIWVEIEWVKYTDNVNVSVHTGEGMVLIKEDDEVEGI